jgi:two-component system, NtrC family, sensor histidine kinase KinB
MILTISSIVLALGGTSAAIYFLIKDRKAKFVLQKREQDISRRMYELAILKELGDRIGYSLDVQQIIDIITSSLHQFIEYDAVSYMLLEPEAIIFKIHLERSVHRRFVTDIQDRMIGSLSALLDREFDKKSIKEVLSGAIIIEELDEPVQSFFNIPLVIDEKVVGILTVADTKAGLYKEEEMTILYKIIQQASKAVTRLQGVVKTEQAKVNAMVESMEDGVVMTDADFRILVINPAAKRVIGLEKKEDITIFDFIDNLGGKMDIRGRLEESVKLKKSFESENFLIKDKFFKAFVFPVKTNTVMSGEDVLGGVVIFHDVTKEMELERVREDFTSMIVHELRTPLDVIKKFSEILKKPGKKIDAQSYKEYIGMIYQNSSGMLNLVNDILDIAKLQAGKFEISAGPGDIAETIDNRIKFFEVSASDKKIKLESLISSSAPKIALFDTDRIKEVLNNLISNALKFTKANEVVSILAFAHNAGASVESEIKKLKFNLPAPLPEEIFAKIPDSLVVVVSHPDEGIPKEQIEELFNKFKQLKNKDFVSNVKGAGLGLAIVKGIVEEHKGRVGAVSTVGVGSAFYFVLPLLVAEKV